MEMIDTVNQTAATVNTHTEQIYMLQKRLDAQQATIDYAVETLDEISKDLTVAVEEIQTAIRESE